MMTKEITTTTIQLGVVNMVNGLPVVTSFPDEILLGNVSLGNAQKTMNQKFEEPVTIFKRTANTYTYELPVEEFLKVAKLKEK